MARSLVLLSAVALMAMIARADMSDSDSNWSDGSSSNANPNPNPNRCIAKTTLSGKASTADLALFAQGADVAVKSGDNSFTFSPCQKRSLASCADKDGKSVSVNGNLVIKSKDACTAATDVYTVADGQNAISYDSTTNSGQWTVNLMNSAAQAFKVMITCDSNAETTQVTEFDMDKRTLTLADYRVCAQDDSALAPITVTEGCTTTYKSFDRDFSSTLTGFQQWFDQQASNTGNNLPQIRVQSCTASPFDETTGPVKGCSGNGYLAFTNANDQCVVLEERSVVFLPENQTFTSKYFNNAANGREFTAQNVGAEEDAKIVQVSCGTENAFVAANSNADFYAFTSPTVCGDVVPSNAPTNAPEKKGLSAGAIAGIIIGVIAVIVLIAVAFVCLRGKSRSAEDGEYNRV